MSWGVGSMASSLALKPREVSTRPVRSGAISVATAPPSEWPVISSDHSPGVPAHALTSSSLSRLLIAWAEVKKPEWTWRGSSDSCPLKPCAHKVHEKSEV